MDCNKACEEIFIHLFTNYLYEQVLSFTICLDEDYLQFGMIPKDHLSPKICENLQDNIQLKGPTGETHNIHTKSIGDAILLTKGWSDFVSCYSLKCSDVLVFLYEGNNTFRVTRGSSHTTAQVGSKGTEGKGKQIAEDDEVKNPFHVKRGASRTIAQVGLKGMKGKGKQIVEDEAISGLRFKRGRNEQKNNIFYTDSEESRDPVNVRKQTPLEHMQISDRSSKKFAQLPYYDDMSQSRNSANAGDGTSGDHVGKANNVSVEVSLASGSTEMGLCNSKASSSTREGSWNCDSVDEILPQLQRERIFISSGSFHEKSDDVKGQRSQYLLPKKELENSENSDSDEVISKVPSKSRFVPGQKPIANKETNRKTSQLAARFRSKYPYFLKEIVESNVMKICRLNVLVKFGIVNLPRMHSRVTLRLPHGSRTWRVKCQYNCQRRPQWFFSKGWSAFACDNNLKVGDWCVFELTHKDKQEINVHIFRVDASNP